MNNRIQEIRDRHAAATPDWEDNGNEIVSKKNPRYGIGGFLREEDNTAAVESYHDIAYILSEYDRLQEEVEQWKQAADPILGELRAMKEALDLALPIVELQSPSRMEQINAILSHLKG